MKSIIIKLKNEFQRFRFSIYVGIFTLSLIIFFQNCSSGAGFSFLIKNSSFSSDSNGGGYSGLRPGEYYRLTPNFTCEQKESPVASLSITNTIAHLIQNQKFQCGAIQKDLDLSLIDSSIYQSDIFGYKEGIYESSQVAPIEIPANLVEVWCRDSKDQTGIESITYYDRQTHLAVNRVYYATLNSDGTYTQHLIPDETVSRVIENKSVLIKNDKTGFELIVHRDQPASELGLFKGHLSLVVDGQKISRDTSCRLGGTIDPTVWPVQQIVDSDILNFQISNDFKTFVYTARGTSSPQLYSGLSNGSFLKNLTQTSGLETTNSIFSISADGKSIIYEVDNNFFNAASLNSMPLFGGAITKLNPSSGNSSVNTLPMVSTTQNKIIYTWGIGLKDFYSVNVDGTNLTKITPSLSGTESYMNLTQPSFGGHVTDYVIANLTDMTSNKMKQYAVAIDGSASKPLTQSLLWTAFGSYAIGGSSLVNQREILNLKTGVIFNLSTDYNFISINSESETILSLKKSPNNLNQQALLISLKSGLETQLCPKVNASKISLNELANGNFLILTFNSETHILDSYITDSRGSLCTLVNSVITTNTDLDTFGLIVISPDQQKVIVTLNKSADWSAAQLFYIPLDGSPAYIINTPVYNSAHISSISFLDDSKTVIFMGDQISVGENNLFLWKAPSIH